MIGENFGAIIGNVTGSNSKLNITTSINMTSSSNNSGFVSNFTEGSMYISIIVNINLSSSQAGSIAFSVSGGNI